MIGLRYCSRWFSTFWIWKESNAHPACPVQPVLPGSRSGFGRFRRSIAWRTFFYVFPPLLYSTIFDSMSFKQGRHFLLGPPTAKAVPPLLLLLHQLLPSPYQSAKLFGSASWVRKLAILFLAHFPHSFAIIPNGGHFMDGDFHYNI